MCPQFPDLNESLDESYKKFLLTHRNLHGSVSGQVAVDLNRAESELTQLNNIIKIIKDRKSQSSDAVSEKLKKAMNYPKLEERLNEEKERADNAKKLAEETPYKLSLEEMKFLLRVFGHEGGGISLLSKASFFDQLKKLSESAEEDDKEKEIVTKFGGKDKVDDLLKKINAHIDTDWDAMKQKLSTGVKNVFEYLDNQQIYKTTLLQKTKLDTEIKLLINPQTAPSRISILKQKKEALFNYIESIEQIKKVHDKYYTSFSTGQTNNNLQKDLNSLDVNIQRCITKINEAKEDKDNTELKKQTTRLEHLKSFNKILLLLHKSNKLDRAITELEKALELVQQIKTFDSVLHELDKKFAVKEDDKILLMPKEEEESGHEISNHEVSSHEVSSHEKVEQNKVKIAQLLDSLDKIIVKGDVITLREQKEWDDIERQIELLEYENYKLEPNRPETPNEEIVNTLKDAVRMTIARSQGKGNKTQEQATQYFKNIKQTIKELREEDDKIEHEDSSHP